MRYRDLFMKVGAEAKQRETADAVDLGFNLACIKMGLTKQATEMLAKRAKAGIKRFKAVSGTP